MCLSAFYNYHNYIVFGLSFISILFCLTICAYVLTTRVGQVKRFEIETGHV